MDDSDWLPRLQEAYQASGLKLRQVETAAGVSKSQVDDIIKGKKEPTLGRFIRICRALGVSPTYILSGLWITPEQLDLLRDWDSLPVETRAAIKHLSRARIAGE